jgi:hypothetical protein
MTHPQKDAVMAVEDAGIQASVNTPGVATAGRRRLDWTKNHETLRRAIPWS